MYGQQAPMPAGAVYAQQSTMAPQGTAMGPYPQETPEDTKMYNAFKLLRDALLTFFYFVALAGIVIGWSAWGISENIPGVKDAVMFIHESDENQELDSDAFEDWNKFILSYLIIATALLGISALMTHVLGKMAVKSARSSCNKLLEKQGSKTVSPASQDEQLRAEKDLDSDKWRAKFWTYAPLVMIFLNLVGAVVLLIHWSLGFTFVDANKKAEEDAEYYYILAITGSTIITVAHLGALGLLGYFAYMVEEICNRATGNRFTSEPAFHRQPFQQSRRYTPIPAQEGVGGGYFGHRGMTAQPQSPASAMFYN